MRTRGRRRLDMAILAGGSVAVGLTGLFGAVVSRSEQIDAVWTSAEVADDGSAQVVEVFDWDFAYESDKHGIERIVPGLPLDTPVEVTADAPDAVEVSNQPDGTRIRIGEADTTVSGQHRYEIAYPLPGVVRNDVLDWETFGNRWEVDIEDAEVHVVAPFELEEAACFTGQVGSESRCDVDTVEPGHLVARLDRVPAGEGVSIEARRGAELDAAPAVPQPPTTRPDDDGTGIAPPALAALGGAALAAAPAARLVRRAGRERISSGGAADVAYAGRPAYAAPTGATGATGAGPDEGVGHIGPPVAGPPAWLPAGEMRVDEAELAEMATIEFAPPAELAPAQGGVVLTETVRPEHKVAWLVQAAIDGAVHIEEDGGRATALVRTGPGTPETGPFLDAAFGGRPRIELGSYDRQFGNAWSMVDGQLEGWRRSSGLWDTRADGRRVLVRVFGGVGFVIGELLVLAGAFAANALGAPFLALVLLGGAVAGAGLAAVVRGWELRVRTAAGSGLWLRVESFRRFLAGSEAYHAEEAAKRGVLREYTAWALALGEIDRWSHAVQSATAIPPDTPGLSYAYVGPYLLASTLSTSTAPQSSGSSGGGGFGGGSVGGGAGGGGGGSW